MSQDRLLLLNYFCIWNTFLGCFFCPTFTCFAPMLKRKKEGSVSVQMWRFSKKRPFWFWICWVSSKFFFRKTFGEDVPFFALTSILAFLDSSSSSLLMSCVELSNSLVLAFGYRRKRERKSLHSSFVMSALLDLNWYFHCYLLYFSYGEIIIHSLKLKKKKKYFSYFVFWFVFWNCGLFNLNHDVIL